MAIKHPQHDLPPDLLNSRLSGASSIWSDDAGLLLLDDFFEAASLPAITGALAATEVGSDAFSAAGAVLVRGALAATEAGADTFSAADAILVRGALAATEAGGDVLSVVGTVTNPVSTGSMNALESGEDVFAALGGPAISGTMAASEITTIIIPGPADTRAGGGAGRVVYAKPTVDRRREEDGIILAVINKFLEVVQ